MFLSKLGFNKGYSFWWIAALAVSADCLAATGGASWSQSNSWSANEPSSSSHKSSRSREAAAASPFAPGSNNLALHIGQVFLFGDLSDKYSNAIGSQLHYTYGISDMFGFDSSLSYSEHTSEGSPSHFSMTTLLTGLRANLSWYDKVIPYGVFGLGFYKPSYQQLTASMANPGDLVFQNAVPANISAVLFGVHLGAGVDVELTKQMFFGAAITLHNMFGTTKVTSIGPVSIGGTYTSLLAHLGVTF